MSNDNQRYLRMKPAAAYAKVSVSTIRRNKESLVSKGAKIDQTGWLIPEKALDEVFKLEPERGSNDNPAGTHDEIPLNTRAEAAYDALIAQLQTENEFLREQVMAHTQTIAEQAKAHAVIAGQLAKLELETTPEAKDPPTNTQAGHETKKRWWKF